MQICAARVIFRLKGSRSLKDKRQTSQAIKSRLTNKFNISISETAFVDDKNILELGLVCTSNKVSHSRSIIDKAILLAEYLRPEAELLKVERYEFSTVD